MGVENYRTENLETFFVIVNHDYYLANVHYMSIKEHIKISLNLKLNNDI